VLRSLPSLFAVALLLACAGQGSDPSLPPGRLDVPIERIQISHLGGVGLSGTALDEAGRIWAVAERARMMVAIVRRPGQSVELQRVALRGVPEGLELESLAWLGPNRFAIGTEQRGPPRQADLVLLAELGGAGLVVTGSLRLDYLALWGILAPDNQGIEGLCAANGQLVAAGEPVIRERKRRFAPVARRDLKADDWVPYLVELTSLSGKLSALDCWMAQNRQALHVLAVERHYGITRLIHFALPLDDTPRMLSAHVLRDLSAQFASMPNVEGVVRIGTEIVLVTDHDSLAEPGTTESIQLGPFDMDDELENAEADD
jgi:hypothetical protein